EQPDEPVAAELHEGLARHLDDLPQAHHRGPPPDCARCQRRTSPSSTRYAKTASRSSSSGRTCSTSPAAPSVVTVVNSPAPPSVSTSTPSSPIVSPRTTGTLASRAAS